MSARPSQTPLRAAGVVVYAGEAGDERFLLLHNPLHAEWGFPKGHLEEGEDDLAAALREAREETGIDALELDRAFREEVRYGVRGSARGADARIEKTVVYFLGRTRDRRVRLSGEHDRCGWFSAEEAATTLAHENLREVARRASAWIRARPGAPP